MTPEQNGYQETLQAVNWRQSRKAKTQVGPNPSWHYLKVFRGRAFSKQLLKFLYPAGIKNQCQELNKKPVY
jgi:hypothetical protein